MNISLFQLLISGRTTRTERNNQAAMMQETKSDMGQTDLHHRLPFNDTVLKDHELTSTDIEKFVKLWHEYQMKNMTPQVDECQGYCQGEIYNWLRAYNSIHGYVSLMVSWTPNSNA